MGERLYGRPCSYREWDEHVNGIGGLKSEEHFGWYHGPAVNYGGRDGMVYIETEDGNIIVTLLCGITFNRALEGNVEEFKRWAKNTWSYISTDEKIEFLDFLCNTINPNKMEEYAAMYRSSDEKGE